MSNIINWKVLSKEYLDAYEDKSKVITTVTWECTAHNIEVPDLVIRYTETTEIPYSPENFIEYENLTDEDLIGWIKYIFDNVVEILENSLLQKLKYDLKKLTTT